MTRHRNTPKIAHMAAPGVPHYNLDRFDFVSIRLAVACARTGSLTEAAHECNLGYRQPAVGCEIWRRR
jgi:hypothetical protein